MVFKVRCIYLNQCVGKSTKRHEVQVKLRSSKAWIRCTCILLANKLTRTTIGVSMNADLNCIQNFRLERYTYRRIYMNGRKFSFTATRERSRKTLFSVRLSDNIPPKMKILDMVIPILMYFCRALQAV